MILKMTVAQKITDIFLCESFVIIAVVNIYNIFEYFFKWGWRQNKRNIFILIIIFVGSIAQIVYACFNIFRDFEYIICYNLLIYIPLH